MQYPRSNLICCKSNTFEHDHSRWPFVFANGRESLQTKLDCWWIWANNNNIYISKFSSFQIFRENSRRDRCLMSLVPFSSSFNHSSFCLAYELWCCVLLSHQLQIACLPKSKLHNNNNNNSNLPCDLIESQTNSRIFKLTVMLYAQQQQPMMQNNGNMSNCYWLQVGLTEIFVFMCEISNEQVH